MLKRITAIVGLILALASLIGIIYKADQRFAKAAAVEQISQRLDQKIMTDRMDNIQERMWKLEDRYGKEENMKGEIRDEYRALKNELKKLEKKLNKE